MATKGHCAYCFEVLAADLQKRPALSYRQVQELWEQWHILGKPRAPGEEEDEGESVIDTQDEDDEREMMDDTEEEEEDEESAEEEEAHAGTQEQKSVPSTLQLPRISHLRVPTPSTPSSSSSSSTPSISSSQLPTSSNTSTTSKSSSATSFFSFSSRSKQPSPLPSTTIPAPTIPPPPREESHPLFITWNLISPRAGRKTLRGCIGTFDPQELSHGLKSYAFSAAYDDHRFPPIVLSELHHLAVSVTLLTHFTPCAHPFDWHLGIHGIRISFSHQGKKYGATYLPDVAVEQGWSKEECLNSLIRKAGEKRVRGWRDLKGLEVVRYEGRKAMVYWKEWRAWREWVEYN
ncbi:hypothetical protein ACLMJK_000112 [Lecanora helva]